MDAETAAKWAAVAAERQRSEDVWVDPANWRVVEVWPVVAGEWNIGAFGGLIGLNWDAAERVLGYYQIEIDHELGRGLHLFSRAYAGEWNRLDAENERH